MGKRKPHRMLTEDGRALAMQQILGDEIVDAAALLGRIDGCVDIVGPDAREAAHNPRRRCRGVRMRPCPSPSTRSPVPFAARPWCRPELNNR